MASVTSEEKKRKGGKVSAFFGRLWKAAKRPFRRFNRDRVVHLSPADTGAAPDLNISRVLAPTHADPADLDLPCLPGQICEELEIGTLPAPHEVQQTPVSDLAPPQSESHRPGIALDSVNTTEQFSADAEALPGPSRIQTEDTNPVLECLPDQIIGALRSTSDQEISPWVSPQSHSSVEVPNDVSKGSASTSLKKETPEKSIRRKRAGRFYQRCAQAARFLLCRGQDSVQSLAPGSDLKGPNVAAEPAAVPLRGRFEVHSPAYKCRGLKFGSLVSEFRVGLEIGSGAFGYVYEGCHKDKENQKVAIKYIKKNKYDHYVEMVKCTDLITQCLAHNAAVRARLEDLEEHSWFIPLRNQHVVEQRRRWFWMRKRKPLKQGQTGSK
ncbi:hypothetical protein DNTS_031146 [Danionella cerebrum]|uniref:non-specific serine/threonine protein kinase n=1 Tax=Danionella cerebrum TaxID=2873325 RepID=A0A553MLQ8_9TELE|nr:hypothetical protein DNTS_031146 [Danionella translucida]